MLRGILAEAYGQDGLTIEHLHLSDSTEICKYISNSGKSLQTIRIRNCKVDRDVMIEIFKSLNTHVEELTVLDLSYTSVRVATAELFRFVTSTETLKDLHLTNSGLSTAEETGKSTGEALTTLLTEHPTLERVFLEKNDFSIPVGVALVEAVTKSPRIKELRLAGSGVGISALKKLDEILTNKIFAKYPEVRTFEVRRASEVYVAEGTLEWITRQREKFVDRVELRRLIAVRYEASALHDAQLAETSRKRILKLAETYKKEEADWIKQIEQKIEEIKENQLPQVKKLKEELMKEKALAELRLEEEGRKRAMEEAEQAMADAKKQRMEQLRVQDDDEGHTIDWVIQQELNAIEALEDEILDLKRRIVRKRNISQFLFN